MILSFFVDAFIGFYLYWCQAKKKEETTAWVFVYEELASTYYCDKKNLRQQQLPKTIYKKGQRKVPKRNTSQSIISSNPKKSKKTISGILSKKKNLFHLLPSLKLTNRHGKSPLFLENTIKMVDLPQPAMSVYRSVKASKTFHGTSASQPVGYE